MKGSPMISLRMSPVLLRALGLYLEKRGEKGHVNAMTRSDFITKAIEEKLAKHKRCAVRKTKPKA